MALLSRGGPSGNGSVETSGNAFFQIVEGQVDDLTWNGFTSGGLQCEALPGWIFHLKHDFADTSFIYPQSHNLIESQPATVTSATIVQ